MEILMLQADIVWERPELNRDHLLRMICDAEPADIIVMPEMFTTGFTMTPESVAAKEGLATLEWMIAVARERDAAVAGSVAVEENGRYYNRFYFVRPDGIFDKYDKRHLFSIGGEHEHYTPGTERVVTGHKGFRILLQICYDLRFPVFARNRGDYDMIIYVASWPVRRIEVWNTLLKARAIENACYVCGVNRVGNDPGSSYNGCSALVDFKGRIVASGETGKEMAIAGFADKEKLNKFRLKFPVLEDADIFSLE